MGVSRDQLDKIANNLIDFGKTIDPAELFPVVEPRAYGLVVTNPYAFCIAACLDRGTKAEIIWTIPYDIRIALDHLDPFLINKLSLKDLIDLFNSLPHKPRYLNDAPKTLRDLTRIVVEECNGDASKIWQGKSAQEVQRTFDSIFGVGKGIANMAVILIEKAFRMVFEDRPYMDIKPDTHTMLVLYRLGASETGSEEAAIEAAILLYPKCPAELDGALWIIGRKWCHPTNPDCVNCPKNDVCMKRGL